MSLSLVMTKREKEQPPSRQLYLPDKCSAIILSPIVFSAFTYPLLVATSFHSFTVHKMAGQSFKFRKGPINLSDDDGALVRLVPVRKRFSMFTAEIHGLMVCTSSLGIAFLLAAYATSDTENAIKRWPEESAMVAISLLIPIIWSGLHVLLFQNYSEGFLGLVCTAQDIIMIIALISFPVVCCSSLTDAGIQGVCDYLMIAGLVCAFLVA